MKKKILLFLCAALLLALMAAAYFAERQDAAIEGAGSVVNMGRTLLYNGKEYPVKRHLWSVLLIGTDSTEGYEELPEADKDFYSYHQADFLMLLVLDTSKQTVEMIQLNRDTMTDVPWLDVFGEPGGTEFKQLCLAFNYGDGGASSCRNTVNAVTDLIFDAPIDGYIQIPMTAIPTVNDLVGGVPVTIPEDMTAIDPAFRAGDTVKLTGAQAEKFVRARKGMSDDTNISRMGRQRIYMDSFQKQAREAINTDSEFVMKLLEKMGSFLQSSLTAQQLSDLIQRMDTYQISPVRYAEGELKRGERYYEFYVDKASLWELISQSYCG